ncbi:MAG: hypothetical protein IT329_17450 [Caldilineaceae bacterium]|nr:hypothetical protein [Caldilineaceae bacterium]
MSKSNGFHATADFDLHGIAGIRLVDATSADVAAVARQLGPLRSELARDPDLIIRFVDRLSLSSPIRYIGVDDAGFAGDAFLVLRSKHKAQARVQIPLAQVGVQPAEIVCERGLPAVPLLIAMINLVALSKGVLPMHASAFSYQGRGVLTTGWSKGGKTETLLAFMAQGADYVGDEWVYVRPADGVEGVRLCGIPEPIRVWDWHLHELPQCRERIGRKEQMRLRLLKLMARSAERAGRPQLGTPTQLMRRLTPLIKQQLHVDIAPQRLFDQTLGPLATTLDKVLFVASHDSPEVRVEPIDPQEVAQRMLFSLQAERLDFMAAYYKYRFAFPAARNPVIEQAEERQAALLAQALAHKPAYALYHPYPVSIPALYGAVAPYL